MNLVSAWVKRHHLLLVMSLTQLYVTSVVKLDIACLDASIRRDIELARLSVLMCKDPKRFGYQNLKLFLLQIYLVGKRQGLSWYLNNWCLWHMIRERSMFLDLKTLEGGSITFKGIGTWHIVGKAKINKPLLPTIDNILRVEGLTYNLLSISDFCDGG